ncbi:MAG TPA: IS3 family transposase [Dehalococcoidia bacterium]|nr:IS3 family transposase [Dehalococcoidia bacterium]
MIRASQPLFPALPLDRACALLDVSRSELYRERPQDAPSAPETALVAAIEAVVLEWPAYGYRRVTAALQRDGWEVNHKRVLRLMRAQGWLCQRRRRWAPTTQSGHGLAVYPNLLADRGWRRLTAVNQAWLADLTYIRLPQGFCYLAAILDAYSRRVVGWSLAETLDASIAVAALEQALAERCPPPGWVHHSDRGVQYACDEYVTRVLDAGGRPSMTAVASPRENAPAESFMRTLKHEEVYLQEYRDFAEARAALGPFIEEVYNQKRLHSSLGYRPPREFEELLTAGILR